MNSPDFNRKYICIADRKHADLASVIASYLHKEGTFLSVFEFPSTLIKKPKEFTEVIDEHSLSTMRGEDLSIKIRNGINKIGGCEYLILAGLNEKQKSYFTYLDEYNVIEISSIDDVDAYLGGIAFDKENFLSVKPNQIQIGLLIAGRKNLKLRIDSTAESLTNEHHKKSGLLVIENNETASVVSAITYALSSNLDVELINPLTESEEKEIKLWIEDWKNGNNSSYNEMHAKLYNRLDRLDFSNYDFVTFITRGAPYSLIIKNQIPCSYVHLNQYPNMFIVDNIFYENREPIGSAVVFSPLEFGIDEETNFVIDSLKNNFFWVKELIGENASAHNIDMNVKEYPYDIFHICSHGGEVNGYTVTKKFEDRDGNKHIVEYDDVISFQPARGQEMIKVEHKNIWRKFNGFIWKSKELQEQNYPHYVFSDMINAIMAEGKSNKKYNGVAKTVVPDSCAITCSDFIYQAQFNMVACFHTAPVIFNNTCWSWSGISESFLNSGARGYIGTLWAVQNNVAKEVAENFYENVFGDSIMNILHTANKKTKGTDSEDIYIYWGLPFSTLKQMDSVKRSRYNITKHLLHSHYRWKRGTITLPNGNTKENSLRLARWDYAEIHENFPLEAIDIIREKKSTANQVDDSTNES